jgi:hypothetical protein
MRHRAGAVVVRSVHAQHAALPRAFSRFDFVSLESREVWSAAPDRADRDRAYAFGLGRGHPIVISAVLNLRPFLGGDQPQTLSPRFQRGGQASGATCRGDKERTGVCARIVAAGSQDRNKRA